MKLPEIIMFAALIIATGDCLAREPEQAVPAGQTRKQDAFAQYDVNRDGVLTMAELARHPMGAHASMADANGDGKLDKTEFAALEAM
jgi:Ca2+-binding EF-hand superfamily protein